MLCKTLAARAPFGRARDRSAEAAAAWWLTIALVACLAAMTGALSAQAQTGQAPGALPQQVPYEMMERGGLFLPSERPGYVIPATTVESDVDIQVTGFIVRATVTQRFVNPSDDWVEGVYVFPLPETAAVDRLRMVIGERVIEGEIMEREAAQQAYAEAAAAGQQASLVSQQRPNLFTNAVANIAPGDSITVAIEYQHDLTYRDGAFDLRFPMVVLPRYIPGEPIPPGAPAQHEGTGWSYDTDQVPDASQITPPVAAPGTGPINPVDLTVTLDPGFPVEAIESPFHPIDLTRNGDGTVRVTLAEAQTYAARDFELIWRPAPSAAPTAGVFAETWAGSDYHLVMLMPPEGAATPADQPREVVFIIDVSGSMAGESIRQAREALAFALARLDQADRFNVIAFADRALSLFNGSRAATPANINAGQRFVAGLTADGGTEMAGALSLALDGRTDLETLRQIVFITDGAVGNEAALFSQISEGLGDSRLFTVGIGSAPNSFFMREAAAVGRGSFTHIGGTDQVSGRMAQLLDRLERPALTDIAIDWPGDGPVAMFPARVPDLYAGEPVVVAARLPEGTQGTVAVTGQRGEEAWRAEADLATGRTQAGIAGLWARRQITDLERQRYDGASNDEIRDRILEVALAHQIVSEVTSVVAIDDEVVRPPEAALESEAVATNMPDGVDMTMAASPAAPVDSLTAVRTFARTGSVQLAQLPDTATWSQILMLLGGLMLALGGLLALLASRQGRPA